MKIELPNGYITQTTFYDDFSIAEKFGVDAIKDTFNRMFNEWKHNYVYLTELVLVTNWKSWYWHERNNDIFVNLYIEFFEKANDYALNTLKGDELRYFFEVTD